MITINWSNLFIPGRFIVPEWTWPGRGTFFPIPGLSRAIRDSWSPYARSAYEVTTRDCARRELAVGRLFRVFILCSFTMCLHLWVT